MGGAAYLALGIFVVGHVWRWRYDQFGSTSRSTQLQERRMLKWGSPLFHYGTFAAIAGHVIGALIPERWTKAIGIPENVYRWFSAGAGTLAAVLVIGGVIVLATRRLFVPRVRATTAPIDYVTLILLMIVILTGIAPTIGVNLFGHGYDYRTTVAPWFRGLFSFAPRTHAIAHAPFIYQLHASAAWTIWALWPFSRLVHAWSYSLWYLSRPYVVYRSRKAAQPSEPGTGGRNVAQDRRPRLTPNRPASYLTGTGRDAVRTLNSRGHSALAMASEAVPIMTQNAPRVAPTYRAGGPYFRLTPWSSMRAIAVPGHGSLSLPARFRRREAADQGPVRAEPLGRRAERLARSRRLTELDHDGAAKRQSGQRGPMPATGRRPSAPRSAKPRSPRSTTGPATSPPRPTLGQPARR